MKATIYHNPRCSTSRTVLQSLHDAGITPTVIEYLKTPPDLAALQHLQQQLQVPARAMMREKEAVYQELNLANPALSDTDLLAQVAAHPVLLQRPIVLTDKGAAVCRPADSVQQLL